MTIATKNGSVILKGGRVAQNCGCCGGWYCYGGGGCECGCSDQKPSTLSASLSFAINQTTYGQVSTVRFGGGAMHQCAKYTSASFSDVSRTVSLSYIGASPDGASYFYETSLSGEYSFNPGSPVPVGFVYMRAAIQCTASGTSLLITHINYSVRPFRGLNQVYVPNNTVYAIKAPCEPESYDSSLFVAGVNAAFIPSPDGRIDREKVFSPPCPNRTSISTPQVNADHTCSTFGHFQYELVQWTPVSSDFNATVVSPVTVGTLTVTF